MFSELFGTFTTLAIIVGVVVFALMAYFLVKYRARGVEPDPEDAPKLGKMPEARGHLRTAIISVGLSSIILGVLIVGTLSVTNTLNTIPSNCLPPPTYQPPGDCVYIEVTAYRFGWNFTYRNGVTLRENLTLPVGRTIVLEISSKAEYPGRTPVFHSFGIDDFRVKRDAIPGLLNKLWFRANSEGQHIARCFELCGSGHAGMTAGVSVVSQGQFSGLCSGAAC